MLVGKHPFQNTNKAFDMKKQLEGKYEKVETGKFSDELIKLMERMMNTVCVCEFMDVFVCMYGCIYMHFWI
jgi:hypothetical protein